MAGWSAEAQNAAETIFQGGQHAGTTVACPFCGVLGRTIHDHPTRRLQHELTNFHVLLLMTRGKPFWLIQEMSGFMDVQYGQSNLHGKQF